MSKQVVTSAKFSSLEVVDSAKFDREIVFEDLDMSGTSLVITASEDLVLSSTGTEAPWGVQVLSVGPINLSHSAVGGPFPVITTAYDEAPELGFFGATPVEQPTTAITPALFAANSSGIADDTATFGGYTIGEVVAALLALGLLA